MSTLLSDLRKKMLDGDLSPLSATETALERINSNATRNVYVAVDAGWALAEAASLPARYPDPGRRPLLYGLPVSLKDCFDLQGFVTSCGSKYYAETHGVAREDSWVAKRLRSQGAVILGKTHLHQLAYGITGENADYGDCAQPRDSSHLTGGSSSGAAASVQEGSAVAAIGTDTGGSIRVPAALCGLSGYRSSWGSGDWRGAAHLAPSFDTLGWLFADLRDGALLAQALFGLQPEPAPTPSSVTIGVVDEPFLEDCTPDVAAGFDDFQRLLRNHAARVKTFNSGPWRESFDIFAPLQASEAAAIHVGHYDHFEPSISERLKWGASLSVEEVTKLRQRHVRFRELYDQLFHTYDFLALPCAPVSSLERGADHRAAREQILRYTTPASLAGVPVVTASSGEMGVQLIGPRGSDARLLAFAASLPA